MSFDYDGGGVGKGGKVTMTADDKTIAEGRIENTIPFRITGRLRLHKVHKA